MNTYLKCYINNLLIQRKSKTNKLARGTYFARFKRNDSSQCIYGIDSKSKRHLNKENKAIAIELNVECKTYYNIHTIHLEYSKAKKTKKIDYTIHICKKHSN